MKHPETSKVGGLKYYLDSSVFPGSNVVDFVPRDKGSLTTEGPTDESEVTEVRVGGFVYEVVVVYFRAVGGVGCFRGCCGRGSWFWSRGWVFELGYGG